MERTAQPTAHTTSGRRPATPTGHHPAGYDVDRVRADFPLLHRQVNGHPLVYLDSASSSQTPRQVVDRMRRPAQVHSANVGSSVNTLGTEATRAYEDARSRVAAFIGGAQTGKIVFTRNATEAINLVAYAFAGPPPQGQGTDAAAGADGPLHLGPGDEVAVTQMEHHSNGSSPISRPSAAGCWTPTAGCCGTSTCASTTTWSPGTGTGASRPVPGSPARLDGRAGGRNRLGSAHPPVDVPGSWGNHPGRTQCIPSGDGTRPPSRIGTSSS
ncbi:aminotransferase class V-fold PLP-dependent enzyme [Solwaraspora sp. WMMA2056]|nr:aminotransferase class V-fold PLP-dependent enzyme [Solwaraspora sp. WMMA2056]WJK42601.1 aminotransferase class V-fold PLP-dependent enzyme [Solwaraspora sp. WMMA2056]